MLTYVGKVGTGFTMKVSTDLRKKLDALDAEKEADEGHQETERYVGGSGVCRRDRISLHHVRGVLEAQQLQGLAKR